MGEKQIGARQFQICARLIEGVLERTFVDGEQKIALLHDLPILELYLVQVPGYARTHLDRIDRDEPADIFVLVDDGALDGLGDRHLGRWRGGLFLGFTAAQKQRRQAEADEGSEDLWEWGHAVGR